MKLTYDPEVDILMIYFKPGARPVEGDEMAPGIIVHVDQDGELIEMEILGAKDRLASVEQITIEKPRYSQQQPLIDAAE